MEVTQARPRESTESARSAFWNTWLHALRQVLPVYIAVHLALLVITCLSVLFTIGDFSTTPVPLSKLWSGWTRYDAAHYASIAMRGYYDKTHTAFFPLYPLLEHILTFIVKDPYAAGFIISNGAGLIMLVVLYQLVLEDFDHERALRTVLYLSLFPTAFFFVAAYTESLFLCLSLLCFYAMRHARWWLAGVFGLLACLTRSTGLFLFFPLCYEYLRWRHFRWRAIRVDVLSIAFVPLGLGLYSLYCFLHFHDWLAFSHVQAVWDRRLMVPWWGIEESLLTIRHSPGILSYLTLHNLLDLGPDLFILFCILLGFIGPWRLPRMLWSYAIYALAVYIFIQCFPIHWPAYPVQSFARYMLSIFPAFIVLATAGKHRTIHLSYLLIAGGTLFFLVTQYLTGHVVI